MRPTRLLKLLLLACALAACSEDKTVAANADKAARVVVVTTNYPLFWFASEIAGDAVDVRFPEIEGDPANWVPDGDEVGLMQSSDLVIANGAGYESWLAYTTLPDGLVLDTTAYVQEHLLPIAQETVHQHGPEGEHSHTGTAFTTWLDPALAIEQARALERGLSSLLPDNAVQFTAALERLENDLNALDQALESAFSDLGEEPVIFSHPVYQYLQNRYAINGISVHWEPDNEPGTRQWIELTNLLSEHPARIMIWEQAPLPEVEQRLAEMGIRSIVFDPAGNRPDGSNYLELMQKNSRSVAGIDTVRN